MIAKRKVVIAPHQIKVCPHSRTYAAWCRGCGKETDLVSFHEAAEIVGKDLDAVINQVAKGRVHLGIRPEALLVCLNSLLGVDDLLFKAVAH